MVLMDVEIMARPTKWRRIEHIPEVPYFIPSDDSVENMDVNILLLEELEAIRLKDLEGLEQAECAEKMEISRPTFQRILLSAREKVADSLIHGKMIHIEGGTYTRNICSVVCSDCSHLWNESIENLQGSEEKNCSCPSCGSHKVGCAKKCKGNFCGRKRIQE